MDKKETIFHMLGFDHPACTFERKGIEEWIEKEGIDAVFKQCVAIVEEECKKSDNKD